VTESKRIVIDAGHGRATKPNSRNYLFFKHTNFIMSSSMIFSMVYRKRVKKQMEYLNRLKVCFFVLKCLSYFFNYMY